MKPPKNHKQFLMMHDYPVLTSNHRVFSDEERSVLTKLGFWLEALADGIIEPVTAEQKHFVAACAGQCEPETVAERAWRRLTEPRRLVPRTTQDKPARALSIRERVRNRVAELDVWDEGDGFVLAVDAGAHIRSYTGPHGWNAGAKHEPPSIIPVLRQVFSEMQSTFHAHVGSSGSPCDSRVSGAEAAFLAHPTLEALFVYAELIDPISPV